MITLQVPAQSQLKWKLAVTSDMDEDCSHEWIVAELRRGSEKSSEGYPLESMRSPSGDVIDIVEVTEDDIPVLLNAFENFKAKWIIYALELGLPFEVDSDIQEFLNELSASSKRV